MHDSGNGLKSKLYVRHIIGRHVDMFSRLGSFSPEGLILEQQSPSVYKKTLVLMTSFSACPRIFISTQLIFSLLAKY